MIDRNSARWPVCTNGAGNGVDDDSDSDSDSDDEFDVNFPGVDPGVVDTCKYYDTTDYHDCIDKGAEPQEVCVPTTEVAYETVTPEPICKTVTETNTIEDVCRTITVEETHVATYVNECDAVTVTVWVPEATESVCAGTITADPAVNTKVLYKYDYTVVHPVVYTTDTVTDPAPVDLKTEFVDETVKVTETVTSTKYSETTVHTTPTVTETYVKGTVTEDYYHTEYPAPQETTVVKTIHVPVGCVEDEQVCVEPIGVPPAPPAGTPEWGYDDKGGWMNPGAGGPWDSDSDDDDDDDNSPGAWGPTTGGPSYGDASGPAPVAPVSPIGGKPYDGSANPVVDGPSYGGGDGSNPATGGPWGDYGKGSGPTGPTTGPVGGGPSKGGYDDDTAPVAPAPAPVAPAPVAPAQPYGDAVNPGSNDPASIFVKPSY